MFFFLLSEIETISEKLDFTLLYVTYKGMMYRVAMSILKNAADAEDAVSAAFESAFIHSKRITKVICPETRSLLSIITRNKAIDIYRRNQKEIPMDFSKECAHEHVIGENVVPFEMPGDNGLADAIAKLSELERDIVLLHVDNGLKYREIAEITGLTAEAIRKRYTRSIERLADELKEEK